MRKSFDINANIIEALREMKSATGVSVDRFVNNALTEALSAYLSPINVDQISDRDINRQFFNWAKEALPLGEKIILADGYKLFLDHYPSLRLWFTSKIFITWIMEYAKSDNLKVLQIGSTKKWVLLYRTEEEKVVFDKYFSKQEKNNIPEAVFEWMDQNLVLDIKLSKSEHFGKLLIKYPEYSKWMSPKAFSQAIDQYAGRAGCKIVTGKDNHKGRWVVLTKD